MKSSLWAFQYAFLSLLLLIILHFPISLSVDDPKYSNCKLTFDCGNIKGVSYPFWGGSRPKYCGGPGFELVCTENGTSKLYISTQIYRVLNISEENQVLIIARDDIWDSRCIEKYPNSSLDFNYFNYIPNYVNLTLFSDCPMSIPGVFNCTQDGVTKGFQFQFTSSASNVEAPPATEYPKLGTCENSVVFTVLEESVRRYGLQNETGWTMPNIESVLREGFEVGYDDHDGGFCELCRDSDGECGYDWDLWRPICFCLTGQSQNQCPKGSKKMKNVIIGVGAGAGVLLLACVFFLIRLRRKKHQSKSSALISRSLTPDSSIKPDLERGTSSYFQTPIFSYAELQEATDNFDSSKEIGDGGFGTVYHGTLRDGRVVAVKRLYENNYKRHDQFMNELEILSRLRHRNLVTLYGCTTRHSRELLLVYEYIPNGTVADNLHGDRASTSPLTWPVRLSVAIETADALSYLHASDIIHRDVKTNNILLDHNFHVKVADFGLSRLFPMNATHVSTAPQGTPGYVDPEYYQCYQLNDKSDVYSFGVVLIELISSKPAVDIGRHRHEINLSNMAINKIHNDALHELVDPSLGFESDYSVRRMITMVAELAFRCLQQEKDMRPGMMEVLKCLKDIESVEKVEKAEEVDIPADARLLKNVPPFSPTSVTDKWVSSTTTPNTSG